MTWDGKEERRRTSPLTIREVQEHMDSLLASHIRNEEDAFRDMSAKIAELTATIKKGFPDGDLDAHRRYHEEMIEYMQERRRFFADFRSKSLQAVLWAGLGWLGAAAWQLLKAKGGAP